MSHAGKMKRGEFYSKHENRDFYLSDVEYYEKNIKPVEEVKKVKKEKKVNDN